VLEFFDVWKAEITAQVNAYLASRAPLLEAVNAWGPDLSRRLADFTARGKMIRGGLVPLGYLLFRDDPPPSVREAAAAMELLQSSFLVHDDIMDGDLVRRGLPTVFRQYGEAGQARGVADARHFGEAMGICAGDASFFFAFDLLARLALPPGDVVKILRLAHDTAIETCVAQMQDVSLGAEPAGNPVREEDVLLVYRYKTGRYTFTLPLRIGALIAGQGEPALEGLGRVGEQLGMIFQIKDDELGIYGSEDQIGKPVGSDIAAGKKTLFYVYLMEAAAGARQRRIRELFGAGIASAETVSTVRRLIDELGVRVRIGKRVEALASDARRAIAALPAARESYRDLLLDLLDYNLSRAR
jgi:geranylgeranyl diphosphate synthase type I